MGEVRSAEQGSASIWVLTSAGVVGIVATVAVLLGQTEIAAHRAGAAADLSAIAAADEALFGQAAACARAAAVAAATDGRLVSCVVLDGVSDVRAEATLPPVLRRFGRSVARSRAGPASTGPQS